MTEVGQSYSSPFQSFILSSWSHTVGPQVLVMWKLKEFSQQNAFTKKFQNNESHLLSDTELSNRISEYHDITGKLSSSNIKTNIDPLLDIKENNLEEFIFLDYQNDNCLCSSDNVFKAIGQLLLGELENYPLSSGSFSRMYLLAEKNIIIITILFRLTNCVNFNGKPSDILYLSLSVVFQYDKKEFIFDIYPIIDLMLRREVTILQQFKVITLDNIRWLTLHLNNICNVVSDLLSFSIKHRSLSVPTTYFNDISMSSSKFFERCLASHFQSCSCSTIIGESENEVNKMIQTLTLFQDERDSCCSSYASLKSKSFSYQPGLFIQGLLKDNYGKSDLWFHDLKFNPYPMTVIDLSQKKVRISQHSSLVCQTVEDNVVHSESQSLKEESSLQTVIDAGKLIPDMHFESRIFNENPAAQEIYAKQFSRYLLLKASSLVKITDKFRDLNISTTPQLLKTIMNQPEAGDFKVIVGCAEKLKPGICVILNEK